MTTYHMYILNATCTLQVTLQVHQASEPWAVWCCMNGRWLNGWSLLSRISATWAGASISQRHWHGLRRPTGWNTPSSNTATQADSGACTFVCKQLCRRLWKSFLCGHHPRARNWNDSATPILLTARPVVRYWLALAPQRRCNLGHHVVGHTTTQKARFCERAQRITEEDHLVTRHKTIELLMSCQCLAFVDAILFAIGMVPFHTPYPLQCDLREPCAYGLPLCGTHTEGVRTMSLHGHGQIKHMACGAYDNVYLAVHLICQAVVLERAVPFNVESVVALWLPLRLVAHQTGAPKRGAPSAILKQHIKHESLVWEGVLTT